MAIVPSGLPELARGRHQDPEKGACIMEYVSMLAGERFSDRPGCVDPLIVRLSWEVNDRLPAGQRQRLVTFAPRLIGTANHDPLVAPSIIAACTAYALPHAHDWQASRLRRPLAQARKRIERLEASARPRSHPWGDRWYRFWAEVSLREAVYVLFPAQPGLLPGLLDAAIAAVERPGTARALPGAPASNLLQNPSPALEGEHAVA